MEGLFTVRGKNQVGESFESEIAQAGMIFYNERGNEDFDVLLY